MPWWIAFKASKAFKPVLGIAAVLIVLGLVYMLGRCSGDNDDVEAQAEQTNRSGEAIADAAKMAIDKVEDRVATEKSIDAAVAATTTEIENAQDVDAIRSAVIAGVCKQAAHRNDPACIVQQDRP